MKSKGARATKIGHLAMKGNHSMNSLEKGAMMNGTYATKDIHSMKVMEKRTTILGFHATKDKGCLPKQQGK
jgi:hypothetical protein